MVEVKKYDDNLSGALFKNVSKQKDTHPDYKGRCCIAGIWYWQSAWVKKNSAGKNYMSQAFTEMTVSEVEQYVTSKNQTQTQSQQNSQNTAQSVNTETVQQPEQTPTQTEGGWDEQSFDKDIPF